MKKLISIVLCLAIAMSLVLSVSALKSIPVKSITLDKSSITLEVGQSYNLKITLLPTNTTQKLLKYSTSNKNAASIDNTGKITAAGVGNTLITITSTANYKVYAKCNVTIVAKPRVKLSLCLSQISFGGEAIDPELMKAVQKTLEDKTNTELELITPPQSSYNDKLNVLLASGQIPDLFGIRKAMDNVQVFAARGYTMPLDNLIKKFPGITSKIDKSHLEKVSVNGQLMAIPQYVPLSKVIWLRKGMLELYGVHLSETPTTDEFYNEMKKIDSKKLIPFTFAKFLDNLPFFFNPFGAYYGIGVKDGKFYDGFNTQESKDALAYVAKLYKDKIWDQEFLTNENAGIREKLFTGRAVSALDYYNRYIYFTAESYRANTPSTFVPVYELIGPKGNRGNLNESIQDALAISSKSKVAEKALEVIQYYCFTEEGVKLRLLGVQGLHYNIENGVIKATPKATNSGYKCDVNNFFMYYPKVTNFGFKWDNTTELTLPQQLKVNEEANRHLGPKYIVPGGKSDMYDMNLPAYKKKIDEISSKIITGAVSVDKGFEEYNAYWKSINGDEMLNQLNK